MIQLTNVSKVFRSAQGEVRALDDVSLTIQQSEFVAVRGQSGCGKSTLLSLVGGLALPTTGQVKVSGVEISAISPTQRAQFRCETIGFVFQMFHLLPYLNIIDNVLVASNLGNNGQTKSSAKQLLQQFGLSDRMTHRPAELSAGERQRVAMARALLNQPKLLLADEPTGNLDAENASIVLELIAKFHSDGGTVLLVTHDDRASAFAQRTIVLHQGKLQQPISAS